MSQQAAGAAGSNFTPEYIFQFADGINITDSVSLGPVEPASDGIDITDSVSMTSQNTGTFLIDSAQIDFSDMA